MRMSLRRALYGGLSAAVLSSVMLAGVSSSAGALDSSSSSAPGVTSNSITVGALATLSGEIASDFAPIVYGAQAYFDNVNAHGGVDGRKIELAYKEDDGGQTSEDIALAKDLVQQDHVFAVVGIGTPFFSPQVFALTGTPAYGYAVENNWAGPSNLFAAYGSVVDFNTGTPSVYYWMKQTKVTKIAFVAYGIAASADACQADETNLASHYATTTAYSDLNIGYGSDMSSEVQRMKAAGVTGIVSCLDVTGNVSLSRDLKEYGMSSVKQLWFDGYDRNVLKQYSPLMQNVYLDLEHLPFEVVKEFPGEFPAMANYLAIMHKYEPTYEYNETALEGWLSADLFTDGVRAAGKNLTQAKVIAADNKITNYSGGLTTPVNWANGGHTKAYPPYCSAFAKVKGSNFTTVFNKGHKIFVCFDSQYAKKSSPNEKGTPGG